MAKILSDKTKFQTITEPIHKYCTKIENKINPLLPKLKTQPTATSTSPAPVLEQCTVYPKHTKRIVYQKRCFLAHMLPDDHSASDGSKQNMLGNVLNVTQLYPSPDLGKVGNGSSELRGNGFQYKFGNLMHCWWLFSISIPLLWTFYIFSSF